jgi:hypothetical protein
MTQPTYQIVLHIDQTDGEINRVIAQTFDGAPEANAAIETEVIVWAGRYYKMTQRSFNNEGTMGFEFVDKDNENEM